MRGLTQEIKNIGKLKTVLMKISSPYGDAKPSETIMVYWIYAERKKGRYPKATQRSGKWL